jgi:hypothetical protein
MSETNAKASEAEKEQAYRSGFRHAVAYLLVALNDQVTPDQMSVRYFTTIDCRQPKCL